MVHGDRDRARGGVIGDSDIEDFAGSVEPGRRTANHGFAVERGAPVRGTAGLEPRMELTIFVHAGGRLTEPRHLRLGFRNRFPVRDAHASVLVDRDRAGLLARLDQRHAVHLHAVVAVLGHEAAVERAEHLVVMLVRDARDALVVLRFLFETLGFVAADDGVHRTRRRSTATTKTSDQERLGSG